MRSISTFGIFFIEGPNATFSRTLIHSNRAPCWKTIPRSAPGSVTGVPPSDTAPAVGARKPATMLSSVVLPHPEGPSTANISPASMSRLMSSSA